MLAKKYVVNSFVFLFTVIFKAMNSWLIKSSETFEAFWKNLEYGTIKYNSVILFPKSLRPITLRMQKFFITIITVIIKKDLRHLALYSTQYFLYLMVPNILLVWGFVFCFMQILNVYALCGWRRYLYPSGVINQVWTMHHNIFWVWTKLFL